MLKQYEHVYVPAPTRTHMQVRPDDMLYLSPDLYTSKIPELFEMPDSAT